MSTNSLGATQEQTPAAYISLLVLGVLLIGLAGGCVAARDQGPMMAPPADFQPIGESDLSTGPYEAELLGQFTLQETADVGVFFSLQNIETSNFDLSLTGPSDDSLVILHSEDYHTDHDGGGLWEHSLPPGTYRLVLTAEQGSGMLSVYWGYH